MFSVRRHLASDGTERVCSKSLLRRHLARSTKVEGDESGIAKPLGKKVYRIFKAVSGIAVGCCNVLNSKLYDFVRAWLYDGEIST